MRHLRFPIVLTCALGWPAGEASAEAIEPNSPWTLEGSEERCSLLRNFGSEDESVQLQIDTFGRHDDFLVTLVGDLVPRSMVLRGEVRYGFDADSGPREQVPTVEGRANRIQYVQFDVDFRRDAPSPDGSSISLEERFTRAAKVTPPDLTFEREVRVMTVDLGRGSQFELALGSMGQPLSALRGCLARLHEHWGLDPALQKDLSSYPIPNRSSVKQIMANYPEIMASEGVNAYIPVRVMVDANGIASHCIAQLSEVEGDFTTEICSGLMNRFEPAHDKEGNPVASFYQVHVLYTMN